MWSTLDLVSETFWATPIEPAMRAVVLTIFDYGPAVLIEHDLVRPGAIRDACVRFGCARQVRQNKPRDKPARREPEVGPPAPRATVRSAIRIAAANRSGSHGVPVMPARSVVTLLDRVIAELRAPYVWSRMRLSND